MRKKPLYFSLIPAILLVPLLAVAADYYKLHNVKKLDDNLYKADGGLVIETSLCLHLTIGEDAILKYEGPGSWGNKIIWDNEESCDVRKIVNTR